MKKVKLLLPLALTLAVLLTACVKLPPPDAEPTKLPTSSTSETEEDTITTQAPEPTTLPTKQTTGTTEASESTTLSTKQTTETSEPTSTTIVKVEISVDFARDELLSAYDSFSEYIESEDVSQRIIFLTNVRVESFSFIKVVYQENGEEFAFFENGELYSLDDFSPEKPFVVTWMETGAIPNRGISFIDESGIRRYFYLATSGEDGSLILAEFENE